MQEYRVIFCNDNGMQEEMYVGLGFALGRAYELKENYDIPSEIYDETGRIVYDNNWDWGTF